MNLIEGCIFFILLIINVINFSTKDKTLCLKVQISNVQSYEGNVLVAIYDSKETFLKEPLQYKIIPIESSATMPTVVWTVFEDLKAGDYAVSVYHDENENFELDRNWIGIPKEMFGFSNNAQAKFSPPSFEDCEIAVYADESAKSLMIRLRNW